MSIDYTALAGEILAKVGGEANVKSVSHCATRLRMVLNDPAKADKAAIGSLPGVIAAVESAGQLQVVIGNNVPFVYEGLGKVSKLLTDTGGAAGDGGPAGEKKGNVLSRAVSGAIDVVSAIFAPIIGTLCGVGILKGLLQISVKAGWLETTSTTYQILWAAADAFFFFLPVILAVPAARKFGANVYTSMALASALLYTQVASVSLLLKDEAVSMPLRAFQQGGGSVEFFGIPVILQSYTASVVPIVLGVFLQSRIEKVLSKHIHEAVRNFIVPVFTLVITLPAVLLALGPVGNWLGQSIADVFVSLQAISPVLVGALFAALWQVLVVFGIHWGFVPVFINNIATTGYDTFKPLVWPAVFAQAGAAFGVFLRLKDARTRGIAGSAVIAGLFGITEPAIYGVTLPRKRVFAIALGSAAVGGAIVGAAGAKVYGYGLSGILTLPLGYGDPLGLGSTFAALLIGTLVSFVLAAVGTYIFGVTTQERVKDAKSAAVYKAAHLAHVAGPKGPVPAAAGTPAARTAEPGTTLTLPAVLEVASPVAGTASPLAEVADPVFATGLMGPGIAIAPTSGRFVAPVTGLVTAALPHAIGITSDHGAEVLIHVGIDTVKLNGQHFDLLTATGHRVTTGDLLLDADLDAIAADGYDVTTMVIVTNPDRFAAVEPEADGPVQPGTPVLVISTRQ